MENHPSKRYVIHEPITVVTDVILSALAVYFAFQLDDRYWKTQMSVPFFFSWAFRMLCIGSFAGAVTHGIGRHMAAFISRAIWKATVLSIGFAAFFMFLAVLHSLYPPETVQVLLWISALVMTGYVVMIFRDDRYFWTLCFYSAVMIAVLCLMVFDLLIRGLPGPGLIVAGILVSFAAAIIQRSNLTLHRHFNHNDLYHVVQMIGLYYLYRGAMMLQDWPAA